MEKKISEDEFLELEQEIDSAVDRLFRDKVELQVGAEESSFLEPTALVEPRTPSTKPGPLEGLEAHLLQLEWEVTSENLRKSQQEIRALKREFQENLRILSILERMEGVLQRMIEKGGAVEPSFMKFLLDGKEAIKFLSKPAEGPAAPYQQLLCEGLEARATLLLSPGVGLSEPTPSPLGKRPYDDTGSHGWKKFEDLIEALRITSEKMDGILSRMEGLLIRIEDVKAVPESVGIGEHQPLPVTVFKAYGKLYGVESEKIYKVFKAPENIWAKYQGVRRIRVRDQEVRLVDLGELFPLEETKGIYGGERMLLVRQGQECIALRIEEVLKRLSAASLTRAERSGSPVMGHIRWRFEDQSVDVPVLDPGRL